MVLKLPPSLKYARYKAASHVYSLDTDWLTPVDYLPYIDAVLGDIDLDPCTTERANNEFLRAKQIYTPKEDGLNIEEPWCGVTYMFPPTYGRCSWNKIRGTYRWGLHSGSNSSSPAKAWFLRLEREWKLRNVPEAIMYATNHETLRTCQQIWDYPVCIPKTRPYFIHGRTFEFSRTPLTWGYFVYLPRLEYGFDQATRFKEVFSELGAVVC
jgi:hypothetical protein